MVVAADASGGGGTRLRERQDDEEEEEPISLAARTSLPRADSLDSSESSSSSSSRDRAMHHAVGSADYDISVDEDGRAEETLTGMGSGGVNSTSNVGTEDTVQVMSVDSSQTVSDARDAAQTVENATRGRAYGDSSETERIGEGDAVTTTAGGSSSTQSSGSPVEALPMDVLLVGALAIISLVFVAGRGL